MKIAKCEALPLKVPFRHVATQQSGAHHAVLLRVETDTGVVGWGETFSSAALQRPLAALLEDAIAPLAVGHDAADIAGLSHRVQSTYAFFGRGGLLTNALAALD